MDLSKLKFADFSHHMNRIWEDLNDSEAFNRFLEDARQDPPIVESLLELTAMVKSLPKSAQTHQSFQHVMCDLHLILALRSVAGEQARQAARTTAEAKESAVEQQPKRFPCISLN